MKNVLQDYFSRSRVFESIYSKKKGNSDVIKSLRLPPNITNSNSNNKSNVIPESLIAQQLRNNLNKLIIIDNINSNSINNKKIDIISENVCGEVIISFILLYNKYINDESATYMINISSRNRNKVKYLFDTNYYRNDKKKRNSKHRYSFEQIAITTKNRLFVNKNNNVDNNSDNVNGMSYIKQELKQYLKNINTSNKNDNNNNNEYLLYQWLLERILLEMDKCLLEIIFLMNDSFGRFKMQNEALFYQLCSRINQ